MTQYHELRGVPLDAMNKGVEEMFRRATKELGLTREELILRDLLPQDLCPGSAKFWAEDGQWNFTISTTSSWTALIDTCTIADNRYVMIYGMGTEESTPSVESIKITRAGSVARIWNLQRVGNQDDSEMFMDDPIIVDQNTMIDVDYWASTWRTVSTCENLIFIGQVVEKRGLTINP